MRRLLLNPLAAVGLLLAGCTQAGGATSPPTATPSVADPIVEVRAALVASGITVVAARDTTASDPTLSCLSSSMRVIAFDEEAPHATFRPGEKPPIDALTFASTAERQAAQHQISSDETPIAGGHCGAMIDWVATPHWIGGGRYLLLVASGDSGLVAQVAAAANRLGAP